MAGKGILGGLIILLIIIIAAAVLLMQTGGSVSVPILMTDPPHVPAGTSALVVSYSSVMVHSEGTNASGWSSASGSGSVDLMAVVNSSKVIGTAQVSAGSMINIVRLNITSATITINGTVHTLQVTNPNITIAVTGGNKINATSNTVVQIDISPTVTPVGATGNFSLVPAASAQVLINTNVSSSVGVGATVHVRLP